MPKIAIPKDANGNVVPVTPSAIAKARTYDATISSSTQVDFNASSTFISVLAIDKPIFMKWGTTAVTSSNFDEIIPAGARCDFYIPKSATTGALYPSATFLEQAATAILAVWEK